MLITFLQTYKVLSQLVNLNETQAPKPVQIDISLFFLIILAYIEDRFAGGGYRWSEAHATAQRKNRKQPNRPNKKPREQRERGV